MKLFEIAIVQKAEDGEHILKLDHTQFLAKSEVEARTEAARLIPTGISSNDVKIYVRPFV